jgi:hypothetical protein
MLQLLIVNLFLMFGGRVFQQTVGIHMRTNCDTILADLFVYSNEADFIRKEARSILEFHVRYIDAVLSLNHSRFGDFVDRMYPIELEIKDTTDTDNSASYLDMHSEVDCIWCNIYQLIRYSKACGSR